MGEMMTANSLRFYIARPTADRGHGVLVLHAWWGLTPVFTQVCDRLAEAGFIALAPDLYHGQTASNREEATRLSRSLDDEKSLAEIKEAIGALRAEQGFIGPGIGVVAFSLGGGFALSLADHVQAVVLYYGASDPAQARVNAPIQGHFADDDEFEPRDEVEKFRDALLAAGKQVEFHFYPGAHHWFFEQNQAGYYDEQAAEKSWDRTLAFLRQWLTPAGA